MNIYINVLQIHYVNILKNFISTTNEIATIVLNFKLNFIRNMKIQIKPKFTKYLVKLFCTDYRNT